MRWRGYTVDALVALAGFAISASVLADAAPEPDVRDVDALAYVLAGVYCGAVVLRRRWPLVAVGVALASGYAYALATYPVALTPLALLPVYSAAAALDERRRKWLLAVAVLVSAAAALVSAGPTDVGVPALVVAAWLLGHYVRSRRDYTAELERKNAELEQAQHDLARQVVTEERLRIARELHDVVAHSMSVVALQAGSARMVAGDDPAAARRALETIETATRSSLQEMRRLLGVLRSTDGGEPGALDPAPGLGDLDALVADVVRSGVTVEVRVEGTRPATVPAGVDLSAFRIVQEALTNVIKHAGPVRATVTVRYGDGEVQVEVVNDDGVAGPSVDLHDAGATSAQGLVGMRERVAVHGGRLRVGPRPGGGFAVHAALPLGATT